MKVLVIDAIAPRGARLPRERGFQVDEVSSKLPRGGPLRATGRVRGHRDTLVDHGDRGVSRPRPAAPHPRPRGRGRGQHRRGRLLAPGRGRRQRAPRQRGVGGRAHRRDAPGAGAEDPAANDALKRGGWDRGIYGAELFRKTAGVIGLGKVGSRVAARLRAFEMDVLVYDPYIPESRARDLGVRLTDLADGAHAVRRDHRARAALRGDGEHAHRAGAGAHEARGAARELRARRHRPRGRSPRRPRDGARRRCGGGRVDEEPPESPTDQAPHRPPPRRGDPAPRRQHLGGAGQRGGGRGPPARGVPGRRARRARGQHPRGRPGDAREPAAVPGPGRDAGPVLRAARAGQCRAGGGARWPGTWPAATPS